MRWPSGKVLQEWEGFIIEVGKKTFWARLLDMTAGATLADEEAEIPISEVRAGEASFLEEGAIFRWRIYERENGDTFSYLRFSRRRWTRRKIDLAKRRADKLAEALGWQ